MDDYPAFYDDAPTLIMFDPLAAFLGASRDGRITYRYVDAVRLAGHSCPTVAGAYLLTLRALRRLYDGARPVRGEIEVHMRGQGGDGVTGVVARVVSLLTGAAQEDGFKGIGGRFSRRGLLVFGANIDGQIGFRRRDTGAGVLASLDTAAVSTDPAMPGVIGRVLAGTADAPDEARFRALWQDRVRRLMIEHAEDPRLITVSDWAADPSRPVTSDSAASSADAAGLVQRQGRGRARITGEENCRSEASVQRDGAGLVGAGAAARHVGNDPGLG